MKTEEIKLAFENNQKIELGVLQDLNVLFEKAQAQVKEAKDLQKNLKSNLSSALIILDQNIPAKADSSIKIADDLDAPEVVARFNALKKKAKDLANEIMPIYKAI